MESSGKRKYSEQSNVGNYRKPAPAPAIGRGFPVVFTVVWIVLWTVLGVARFLIPFMSVLTVEHYLYWYLLVPAPVALVWGIYLKKRPRWFLILLGSFLFVTVALSASSWEMFRAGDYASLIDIPKESEAIPFDASHIPAFDEASAPRIDIEQAKVLGDKVIGQLGGRASQITMGEYHRQEVGGELYFIAPLLHSGFSSYTKNPEGTEGFVMVNAVTGDARLVRETADGAEIRIRIQTTGHAAFGDRLPRRIFNYRPSALGLGAEFEVDDNLRPYWVVPLYRNRIGLWDGLDVVSVILVDAMTGDLQEYAPGDVPEWVDGVYPTNLIEYQIDNWGLYNGGWWNSVWAKTNLVQSDPGNAVVYRDGDCYIFDSLTSRQSENGGKDESTIGFLMINRRTKEVARFKLSGATEWAAQMSAMGDKDVAAQRYEAAYPIPTMVDSTPTYFMTLLDPSSKVAKAYAFVSIEDFTVVGTGDSIQKAEAAYRTRLHSSGIGSDDDDAQPEEITGKVLRWGQTIEGGTSYYTFILEGYEDRLIRVDSSFAEASITQVGDIVSVTVVKTDTYWNCVRFDNLEFTQTAQDTGLARSGPGPDHMRIMRIMRSRY